MRSCSTKYGSIILSSRRAMRDNIYRLKHPVAYRYGSWHVPGPLRDNTGRGKSRKPASIQRQTRQANRKGQRTAASAGASLTPSPTIMTYCEGELPARESRTGVQFWCMHGAQDPPRQRQAGSAPPPPSRAACSFERPRYRGSPPGGSVALSFQN